MRKTVFAALAVASAAWLTSCEGCRRGGEIVQMATDALEQVTAEAGVSLGNIEGLLGQHADSVVAAAGRTLVQAIEGVETRVMEAHYDRMECAAELAEGVSLDFLGKLKSADVVDAYFVIDAAGTYDVEFELGTADGLTVAKKATIEADGEKRNYVAGFALDADQVAALGGITNAAVVQVTVTKRN
jgi:hypothetical protein